MQNPATPKPNDILRDLYTGKHYTVSDLVTLDRMTLILLDWYGFNGAAGYGRRSKAIEAINWSDRWEIVEPSSLYQERSTTRVELEETYA